MTDWELLHRYASERDETAFAALVERHINLVYNTARRQLWRSADLADDVVQSVFLLLAQKVSSIPSRRPLAAWLYRAVCYCCNNVRKAEARRRRREGEVAMHAQVSFDPTPDSHSLLPMLDEGVSSLGEKERSAILLRYLATQSSAEAAVTLGISGAALEKRVERGLAKLRTYFSRRGLMMGAATVEAALAGESAKAAPAGLSSAVAAMTLRTPGEGARVLSKTVAANMVRAQIRFLAGTTLITTLAVLLMIASTVLIRRALAGQVGGSPALTASSSSQALVGYVAPTLPRETYYAEVAHNVFDAGMLKLDGQGRPIGWSDLSAFDQGVAHVVNGFVRLENDDAGRETHFGTTLPVQAGWKAVVVSARMAGEKWRYDGRVGAVGGVKFEFLDAGGRSLGHAVVLAPAAASASWIKIRMATMSVPDGAATLAIHAEMAHVVGRLSVDRFLVVPINMADEPDPRQVVELHNVIRGGDVLTVRSLIQADKRLLECRNMDYDSGTPLVAAAWEGDVEVSKVLLELGAAVTESDQNGPLISGTQWDTSKGEQPLSWAAYFGRKDEVRLMLDAGADPTHDAYGTALNWCEQGAKTKHRGGTPQDYKDIMEMLKQALSGWGTATRPGQ